MYTVFDGGVGWGGGGGVRTTVTQCSNVSACIVFFLNLSRLQSGWRYDLKYKE